MCAVSKLYVLAVACTLFAFVFRSAFVHTLYFACVFAKVQLCVIVASGFCAVD